VYSTTLLFSWLNRSSETDCWSRSVGAVEASDKGDATASTDLFTFELLNPEASAANLLEHFADAMPSIALSAGLGR
jgi:hypothetical protein